jgi:hypothetical protein
MYSTRPLNPPPTVRDDIVKRELFLLAAEREKNPHAHAELMAIRIGEAAIMGIPAEFFSELGMKVKLASPFQPTFVIELANGCVGYIPTVEAFTGGGYETELVRSSKLVPEAADIVVRKASELLISMKQ